MAVGLDSEDTGAESKPLTLSKYLAVKVVSAGFGVMPDQRGEQVCSVLHMAPFGQGFRDMSPPGKELMRIVLEKKLNHGGHPVLRWNFDNVYAKTDPAGNIKPDKEKSTEKIDGAVALIMALDRAMKNGNGGTSVYDDCGFLTLR